MITTTVNYADSILEDDDVVRRDFIVADPGYRLSPHHLVNPGSDEADQFSSLVVGRRPSKER